MTLDLETGRELRSTPLVVGEFDEPYFLLIHPDGQRMAVNTGWLKYDIWLSATGCRDQEPVQALGCITGSGKKLIICGVADLSPSSSQN